MDGAQPQYQDEIDLIEVFETLWEGKWKLIGAIIASISGMFAILFILPPPPFTAVTNFSKVPTFEAEHYKRFNAFGFMEITPTLLLDLYTEQLAEGGVFEQAMRNAELLDSKDFVSVEAYDEALTSSASSIELIPPQNDGANANAIYRERINNKWQVVFEHVDEVAWKAVLKDADRRANEAVRRILEQRFDAAFQVATEQQIFALEDINTKIKNAQAAFDRDMKEFELNHGFDLEDVASQIQNALLDYDKKIMNRLTFLDEQAKIARAIGVAKNTIEAQTFNAQSGFVANVNADTPFYLRGYEAIEKEIELIKAREQKHAFIDGLFELEQKKRALEQDKTLHRAEAKKLFLVSLKDLEAQKRDIEQDPKLQRAKQLFLDTPIFTSDDFKAAHIRIDTTQFTYARSWSLLLALSALLGAMAGVVYVLLSNALAKRKRHLADRQVYFQS